VDLWASRFLDLLVGTHIWFWALGEQQFLGSHQHGEQHHDQGSSGKKRGTDDEGRRVAIGNYEGEKASL
jgi:hypothetical protein